MITQLSHVGKAMPNSPPSHFDGWNPTHNGKALGMVDPFLLYQHELQLPTPKNVQVICWWTERSKASNLWSRWSVSCPRRTERLGQIWQWVKTNSTPGEHQNSWDLWMFIPLKMVLIGIDYWFIAICFFCRFEKIFEELWEYFGFVVH